MFCPRCATENRAELAYCPKCGQGLADVQRAIEGIPSESLAQLRAGAKWMNGGVAALIAFTLIGVIITIIGLAVGDPSMSTIAMINVLLGALIGVPLVLVGKASMKRATRLLSQSQTDSRSVLREARQELLPAESRPESFPPASVTEHTTLNLRRDADNHQERE